MARRDAHSNIKVKRALSPVAAAPTGNTALVTEILDTSLFFGNELVIALGSIADVDATFVVLMEEGDNSALSDAAAVADSDLLGTEAGAAYLFSDDDKTVKIGYRGRKQYIRCTITPSANTGNHCIAALWIQSSPRTQPQSSQIVA